MIRTASLLMVVASIASAAGCVPGTDYQGQGWHVHAVRVHHPFRYLSWLRNSLGPAFQAASALEGKPFNNAAVEQVRLDLENGSKVATLQRVSVLVSGVGVTECTEDKQLDLVFTVVDLRVSPTASLVLESREQEQQAPEEAAGQVKPKQFRLAPSGGYNAADQLFAGGTLDLRNPRLHVDGFGSGRRHDVSVSLEGSRDPDEGRIAHSEWHLRFHNSSQPAAERRVGQGYLSAFAQLNLRPTRNDWVFRFAGSVEGGFAQSTFTDVELDSNTVGGSSYGSIKTMTGLTKSTPRHALAATYGLELGATGRHVAVDWLRHLADVSYQLWVPVVQHRPLELEARGSIGALQTPGKIPAAQRFFGGNVAPLFLPIEDWDVRAAPLIRGIPSYQLARFQNGAGARSFQSINLTGAIAAWGKPLVPLEASQNPEIRKKIDGQLKSAMKVVKASVGAKDKAFLALVPRLKDLGEPMTKLVDRVAELPESDAVTACSDLLEDASDPLERLQRPDSSPGTVWDSAGKLLTAEGDFKNYLATIDATCVVKLDDATVKALGERLRDLAKPLRSEYEAIAKRAEAEAVAEMKPPTRIVNLLMDQVNLVAVSPVAIFDAARIDGTSRYSAGGGIRFSLVSTVSFTLGWAWNINRKPGEGSGAVFFSTQFKDLFH